MKQTVVSGYYRVRQMGTMVLQAAALITFSFRTWTIHPGDVEIGYADGK